MENRAAVFTSQPQAVEVYQAGAWWAGELLGWRHDANGSCQVWVRVVLGGVEETAWTELASLRLPERHLAVAAQPAAPYAPATQEMSVARHPSGRRARPVDPDSAATAGLPMVRDLSVVPGPSSASSSGGRRRAPDTGELPAAGGRRRAPEEPATVASAGRRRAPEQAVPAIAGSAAPLGRHRAPADPGRHRTADTGLFAAVPDAAAPVATETRAGSVPAAPAAPPVRGRRLDESARSSTGWTAPKGMDADLLTRPMRLSDHAPHARRPRLDGALRSV
jgi:hypothetical protein